MKDLKVELEQIRESEKMREKAYDFLVKIYGQVAAEKIAALELYKRSLDL